MPGVPGFRFDEACNQVEDVACPCFTREEVDTKLDETDFPFECTTGEIEVETQLADVGRREIATVTDLPLGTVKTYVARGATKLRKWLEGDTVKQSRELS